MSLLRKSKVFAPRVLEMIFVCDSVLILMGINSNKLFEFSPLSSLPPWAIKCLGRHFLELFVQERPY